MFEFFSRKPVQIALIVLLTALAYSNIFQNDFVSDDRGFVKRWASTQQLSDIPKILAGDGPPFRQESTYRPIRDSLYVVYYRMFGENTFFWHLHSLVVHVGVTVLVYLMVEQLVYTDCLVRQFKKRSTQSNSHAISSNSVSLWPSLANNSNLKSNVPFSARSVKFLNWLPSLSFVTALLFGVHPIHTEAITFMTSSMDMVGPLFMFGSFWLYLQIQNSFSKENGTKFKVQGDESSRQAPPEAGQARTIWLWIGSAVLAGLAFFSYEMTLVLPLLLVLYEICFGKLRTKFSIIYITYFVLVLFYLVVRVFVVGRSPLGNDYWVFRAVDYSRALEPEIFLKYLTLLLMPVNLSFSHVIGPGFDTFVSYINDLRMFDGYSFLNFKTILGIGAFLALILAAVWTFKRNRRLVSFAIAWYLISQLPYSNIWPQPTVMAERYLYIASFGFALISADLILIIADRIGNRALLLLAVGIIALLYGVLTFAQNTHWKDRFAIWERVSEVYPKSGLAYYNLANTYVEEKDYEKAAIYMQKALSIQPANYYYLFNLGNIYYEKIKDNKKAISYYLSTIDKNPTYSLDVYLALAEAYAQEKMMKNAVSYLVLASNIPREQTNINNEHYDKLLSSVYKKLDQYSLGDPTLWSLYQGPFGILFAYPPSWKQEVRDGQVMFTSRDDFYHLEVSFGEFGSDFEFAKYVDSQPEDLGSLVIVEPAEFEGIPLAYVRVFDDGKDHRLQFFLFKKGRIIKILAYPSVSELGKIVDSLVSTIKIEDNE